MSKPNAIRLLEQAGIKYDTVEYEYDPENLSLDKIAADNGLDIERIFKTLVISTNAGEVLIAVVAGNHSLANKKLAALAGAKKADLVPIPELPNLTGYVRGGCSPIGTKKKFRVFIDETAQFFDWVYVNAGKRGLLFGCSPDDLCAISEGAFADICA